MIKKYCKECGGEIIITWEKPDRSFTVEENSFAPADNNDAFGIVPFLHFHCENDNTHNIEPTTAVEMVMFDAWKEEVEKKFQEIVLKNI